MFETGKTFTRRPQQWARRSVLVLLPVVAVACSGAEEASTTNTSDSAAQSLSGAVLEGSAPRAASGMPSVVFLEPLTEAPPGPPGEAVFVDQVGGQFFPQVQLARVGQRVQFTNAESEMHNVEAIRIETGTTDFNVTTAPFADPFEYVFDEPGVARLTCGIHSGMLGFVVISPSPWAAIASASGALRIEGIPAGVYRLTVWSANESLSWEAEVELTEGATVALESLRADQAETLH
jgi:plastocyanin